ncbi:MAG: M48 family metalloprotease [Streptosporangiales bacterium]|nr:M48 family metalloprotease [Streptosporangiales bacterium]
MATGLIGLAFGRPGLIRRPGIVQLLVAIGALGYVAYSLHPALLTLFAVPLLVAWFRRLAERYADRVAADLGYGPALAQVFQASLAAGGGVVRGIRGTLPASHPSHVARIKALEKRIRSS